MMNQQPDFLTQTKSLLPTTFHQLSQQLSLILSRLPGLTQLIEIPTLLQQTLTLDQVALYQVVTDAKGAITLQSPLVANATYPAQAYPAAGLPYQVAREGQLLCFNHLAQELPDYYQTGPTAIQAELYCPLYHDQQFLGVLSFGSTHCNQFADPTMLGALQTLAIQVGLVVNNLTQEYKPVAVPIPQPDETNQPPDNDPLTVADPKIFTQELREVFTYIVNEVVNQLGYKAAMVAVVHERSQILSLQALAFDSVISRLGLLEKAERTLGIQAVGAYQSLVHDTESLGVKSCKTGQTMLTHDLYDLFRPVVSRPLCKMLQKTSGVKTCISLPLRVKDKVVGNLFAGTKRKTISSDDAAVLQMFATNTAIALRNALHLDKIQRKLDKERAKVNNLQSTLSDRMAELKQLRDIERLILSLDMDNIDGVLRRILDGALKLTDSQYAHVILEGKYATQLVKRVSYPEQNDLTQTRHNTTILQKVKIELNDEVIGKIVIGNLASKSIDPYTLYLLEQLAVQAGIAIRNAYQVKQERERERQLRNVEQVTAMGDMASNMVHRINNWVGAIQADIHELQEDIEADYLAVEILPEMLHRMLRNAEKTLALAERIRRPFQQAAHRELIDTHHCIEAVLQEDNIEQYPEVRVLKRFASALPLVQATQQLQLVFQNLFSNGLQAMDYQGTLTIETGLSFNKQWVEVRVRDTGPGILDRIKRKDDIFKLGITTRKSGLGYGLWWCDTYLNRLGGDIQLVATSTRGCVFLVKLPILAKGVN